MTARSIAQLMQSAASELKLWPKGHVVHPPSVAYDETCGQCRVDRLVNELRTAAQDLLTRPSPIAEAAKRFGFEPMPLCKSAAAEMMKLPEIAAKCQCPEHVAARKG